MHLKSAGYSNSPVLDTDDTDGDRNGFGIHGNRPPCDAIQLQVAPMHPPYDPLATYRVESGVM